jgi:hypothetical protein
MSSNADSDNFWSIASLCCLMGVIAGTIWWVVVHRTPDAPFTEWLATASRDDVFNFLFSAVTVGVMLGRVLVRGPRAK